MENLPKDVLVLLAMEMDYPEILKFCQTNKNINQKVCKNNYFWRNKLYITYPSFKDKFEDKDYSKVYRYVVLGKKILDNIPAQNFVNFDTGLNKLVHIKQELVDFLLNADLGVYRFEDYEIPINYILLPLLDKKIFSFEMTIILLMKYLQKYKVILRGKSSFRIGPEMQHYLNKQITELENDSNNSFNRENFTYNTINKIVKKLVDVETPVSVTSEILPDAGKIRHIIKGL